MTQDLMNNPLMVSEKTLALVYTYLSIFPTAFPTSTFLFNNPPNGTWGQMYTAKCPHSFGALAMERPDLYSITWTVRYSTGDYVILNSSTTEYTLASTNLIISRFTPFVQSLACAITVTGIPNFQLQPKVYQQGFLVGIASNGEMYTSIIHCHDFDFAKLMFCYRWSWANQYC